MANDNLNISTKQLLQPETGWKRIDDNNSNIIYNGTGWIYGTASGYNIYNNAWHYSLTVNDSYDIYFKSSNIRLMCYTGNTIMQDNNVKIILDDNIIEYKSEYMDNGTNCGCWLLFERLNLVNTLHHIKVVLLKGNGSGIDGVSLDAIDIDEDGYLLTEEEYKRIISSFYIKQDNKYYSFSDDNYDTNTKMYKEITLDDINNNLYKNNLSNLTTEITIGDETFKPIDKFNNFQFVSKYNKPKIIIGRKTKSSMIIANGDIYTKVASNIDKFTLTNTTTNNSYIKMAVSFDNGSTWKSYTNNAFTDLSITIANKSYEDMTTEERNNWNDAKNIIMTEGFSPSVLETINFNTIKDLKNIRFVYVLYQDVITDNCKVNRLSWQFDAKGSFQKMKDSEITTSFSNGVINLIPNENQDMIITNYIY